MAKLKAKGNEQAPETPIEYQDSRSGKQSPVESSPRVDGLASSPVNAPKPEATPKEPAKEKLIVPLSDSGGFDFSSMREKTREKFLAAARRTPDLLPKSPDAPITRLPDAAVMAIYNLIGVGETMLATRTGIPEPIAVKAFMWSREEIDLIMEPSQALIAKHLPRLRGWEEETAWALVFAQIHFAKVHVLRSMMADYEARKKMAAQTPGPKPPEPKQPVEQPLPEGVN
jgi:hypothetical protein